MSLFDPKRSGERFELDDAVRRVLAAWGREPDGDMARLHLARGFSKLTDEQRSQLVHRVAEISLGMLFTVLQEDAKEQGSHS